MSSIYTRQIVAVLVAAAAVALSQSQTAAEVTVERSEHGAIVKIDGEQFCEYLTRVGHQPAIWPIIGPTGKPMTRQYPMGILLPGEKDDHLHHVSLWFAHGNVNGLDFWTAREATPVHKDNHIAHQEFVTTTAAGNEAKIVTRNDWISEEKKVCEDERTLRFGGDAQARWIDFSIKLKATEGDVTLGESKEGAFGLRVSGPLTVDAKQGAAIINSRGQRDADAWGMFADWVDDYGPVDGEAVGIALFNHPGNFRNPTRWHARTYGLLAANPFGDAEFPEDSFAPNQGALTIPKSGELALRYRVVFHRGDPDAAGIAEAYKAFAATPGPSK
jgi:Family of unknown function (DUF6807)